MRGCRLVMLGSAIMFLIITAKYIDTQEQVVKLQSRIDEQREVLADTAVSCTSLNEQLQRMTNDRDRLKATVSDLRAELKAHDEIALQYLGEFRCTAYCCEKYEHICGTGSGITASGAPVTAGVSVAVSGADLKRLPFGTLIYIEGVGTRIVQDTGGMTQGWIDVAVPTHAEASAWAGVGNRRVFIITKGE